ncbi:MAG: beta-lactamase family protein [Alphaproteobacteria bacterium]|nr:beta-lactamase family protein [Alphaproteobacteria bacterium]
MSHARQISKRYLVRFLGALMLLGPAKASLLHEEATSRALHQKSLDAYVQQLKELEIWEDVQLFSQQEKGDVSQQAYALPVTTIKDEACPKAEATEILKEYSRTLKSLQKKIALCQKIEDSLTNGALRPLQGLVLIAQGDEPLFYDMRGTRGGLHLDAPFLIASLSKQVTAALVLRVRGADGKKLNVHEPIKTYFPKATDTWMSCVSLHHMLTHTSGIKAVGESLLFEPGSQFNYSNEVYDLVGTILEMVTGQSYNQLVQDLFAQVGMKDSLAPDWDILTECPCVTGYFEALEGNVHVCEVVRATKSNPSSGLVSTARDLLKWNRVLHTGKLLSDKRYKAMCTPFSNREKDTGYGYGVQIHDHEEGKEVSHNGIAPGYLSTLKYVTKKEVSIIVLENCILLVNRCKESAQENMFEFQDQISALVQRDPYWQS